MQLAQTTHTHTKSHQHTLALTHGAAAISQIADAIGKAGSPPHQADPSSRIHNTNTIRLQLSNFALFHQGVIYRFSAVMTPAPWAARFLSAQRLRQSWRKKSLTVSGITTVRTPHPIPQPDADTRPTAGQ